MREYLISSMIPLATCSAFITTMDKTGQHNSDENINETSSGQPAQVSENTVVSSLPKQTDEAKSGMDCDQVTKPCLLCDGALTNDEKCLNPISKPSSPKEDNLDNNMNIDVLPKLYSTSMSNDDDIKNNSNISPKSSSEEIHKTSPTKAPLDSSNSPSNKSPLEKSTISRQESIKLHSKFCPSTTAQKIDEPNIPVRHADKTNDLSSHTNTPEADYSDDDMPSCKSTTRPTLCHQASSFDWDNDGDTEQKKDPIYAKIPSDLKYKWENFPQNTIVPFFFEGKEKLGIDLNNDEHWKWRNSKFVRLPQSPINLNTGRKDSGKKNWVIIEKNLKRLKKACEQNNIQHDMGTILKSVVKNYKPDAGQISNFCMLGRPELQDVLKETLPVIVELALQLPQLLSEPLPILKNGENKTIYLTRKLCSSLLANAFFCTFPEPSPQHRMPDYNFIRLFNDTNTDRCEVKKEKLKCILNFFNVLSKQDEDFQNQIVSFERRSVSYRTDWENSDKPMCEVNIEPDRKIEEAEGMLQIDFANKYIGGGVLNDGSVQEEIRFCISPELIIGRIFMEAMSDDEAIIITGSQIYSDYTGYSTSFKFADKCSGIVNAETDNLGRTFAQLAAIDALNFRRHDADKQFEKKFIDRELHKCFVAFIHGKKIVTPVATGNWGCGAFNGNPELKFLIQWIAASHQERPVLQFHKVKDQQQEHSIQDITSFLQTNKVLVGQLYKTVTSFHREMDKHRNSSLFNYIKEKLTSGIGKGQKGICFGRFR